MAEMLNLSNDLHSKAFPHIPTAAFEATDSKQADDPMIRSKNLLQLGINYRWSQIVLDERFEKEIEEAANPYGAIGATVRAGDRAPYIPSLVDLASNQSVDFFNLLGTSHLLLVLKTKGDTLQDIGVIRQYADDGLLQVAVVQQDGQRITGFDGMVLRDEEGVSFDAYDASTSQKDIWVVIRPDGLVGAYGFSASVVERYFDGLGL